MFRGDGSAPDWRRTAGHYSRRPELGQRIPRPAAGLSPVSPLFLPRGEAKCVRGPSARGACRSDASSLAFAGAAGRGMHAENASGKRRAGRRGASAGVSGASWPGRRRKESCRNAAGLRPLARRTIAAAGPAPPPAAFSCPLATSAVAKRRGKLIEFGVFAQASGQNRVGRTVWAGSRRNTTRLVKRPPATTSSERCTEPESWSNCSRRSCSRRAPWAAIESLRQACRYGWRTSSEAL